MERESSCQGLRVDWRDSRGAAMVDEASRMKVVMGIVTCILGDDGKKMLLEMMVVGQYIAFGCDDVRWCNFEGTVEIE